MHDTPPMEMLLATHFAAPPRQACPNRVPGAPPKKRNRKGKEIIENPKEFAATFAHSVTAPSDNNVDWVARNGEESLFRTLQRVIPEVSYRSVKPFPASRLGSRL